MGWDVLLWRAAETAGGTVIDLPKDAGTKAMTWRAVNCLYAGWETLLLRREPLAGTDTAAWHEHWDLVEGDVSQALAWARAMPADPAEAPPSVYHTFPGPTGYAATSGPGHSAATWGSCRGSRSRWIDLSAERAVAGDVGAIVPDWLPANPRSDRLNSITAMLFDLDKIDLGVYLRDVAERAGSRARQWCCTWGGRGGTGRARYESRMPT